MASARPVYPQTLQSTAVLLVQAYIHERAKLTYRACSHGLLSLVIPCSERLGAGWLLQQWEDRRHTATLPPKSWQISVTADNGLSFIFALPGHWEYKFVDA